MRIPERSVCGLDPYGEFKKLRGKMAVSFQQDRLLPWRTAIENVELGLLILNISKAEARKTAKLWLARVNLADAEDKMRTNFPAVCGSAFRLRARSRSIPSLCCSMNFSSQLDHVTSKALRADFSKVAREFKKTCLFVTHRIEDAIEMADRVLVLRPGAGLCLEERVAASVREDEAARAALHDRIAAAMGDHGE